MLARADNKLLTDIITKPEFRWNPSPLIVKLIINALLNTPDIEVVAEEKNIISVTYHKISVTFSICVNKENTKVELKSINLNPLDSNLIACNFNIADFKVTTIIQFLRSAACYNLGHEQFDKIAGNS